MWLYFALLAGVLFTVQRLISRHILKGKKDSWAFSFYYSAVGALTSLPFVISQPQFSQKPLMWLLMLGVGILIVTHNLLSFKSTNNLEPSLQGSISKFRLLWVLIIGIIFLNESMSWIKVIGTLLTILAGITTVYKLEKIKIKKSIGYAFLATLVYGIVIGLYKILFNDFNSVTLTFLIFFIPAILNLLIMPDSFNRIISLARNQGKLVFVATFFGGLGNLALNQALSLGDVSKSLVINEAFLIIVLMGEHFLLKEKKNLTRKIIAVILATLGAILIRLSN